MNTAPLQSQHCTDTLKKPWSVQRHGDMDKGGNVRGVPMLPPHLFLAGANPRRTRRRDRLGGCALGRVDALPRCRRAGLARIVVGAARLRAHKTG